MNSKDYFYILIVGVTVFAVVTFLLKSAIRALIVTIVAVTLFRIGWVYSADELFDKFKLNHVIKEEHQEEVYKKYDNYTKKRNESGLIDGKKVDRKIREEEEKIKSNLEKKLEKYRE